jgi:hypothetical protein
VKKELRRLRKLERSSKQPTTPPPAPAVAIPAEGIPIFWVKPSGRQFFDRSYRCANDHFQTVDADDFNIGKTPVPCDRCDLPADPISASKLTEFVNPANGQLYRSARELPPGAVYEHPVYNGEAHNWVTNSGKSIIHRPNPQDGRILCCVLPDGHSWTIDSRANNCTEPDDDEHWCWVRHGRPEDGTLHVGKDGRTCSAGAGSIQTGRWHGFLRHGRLVL